MEEDFKLAYLETVKGPVLDQLLALGWYRMGMYVFTTNGLQPNADGELFPVYWLRYDVNKVLLSKSSLKIIKAAAGLEVYLRPFKVTPEVEELHSRYREHLSFNTDSDLTKVIADPSGTIFNTLMFELRDKGKLIGLGIFDVGDDTIAGIKSIYDPAYKKYSPGKYLMLLKLDYCRRNYISWYYPGYFSPRYPKFDYKLFVDPAATEVYLPERNAWVPYERFVQME
jgi:arginine-tRNA-protein transferase